METLNAVLCVVSIIATVALFAVVPIVVVLRVKARRLKKRADGTSAPHLIDPS